MWIFARTTRFDSPHEVESRTAAQVRDILETIDFRAWYARYARVRRSVEAMRAAQEDPVLDAVVRQGELHEAAAASMADYAHIDGCFELLNVYEGLTRDTETALVALQRAENELETVREAAAELKSELVDLYREREVRSDTERPEQRLKRLQARMPALTREVQRRQKSHLDSQEAKRAQWQRIAHKWGVAFRAQMVAHELTYLADNAGREAERQTRSSACGGSASPAALAAAQSALEAVVEQVGWRFGAVAVDSFLYWPHAEDPHGALAVPLVDDTEGLNLQVEALKTYALDRRTGLERLEPLAASSIPEVEDRRLEAFFCAGRPVADAARVAA